MLMGSPNRLETPTYKNRIQLRSTYGGAPRRRMGQTTRAGVQAVDEKKARLNCIAHLLSQVPNHEVAQPPVHLPEGVRHPDYPRHPVAESMHVPQRH
jgi:hypothetical protein